MTDKEVLKFLVQVPDGKMDQLRTYHDLLAQLDSQQGKDDDGNHVFKFVRFDGHVGPLKPTDAGYNHSKYNILVTLEDGSSTYEPLHILAKDAPDMSTKYAI